MIEVRQVLIRPGNPICRREFAARRLIVVGSSFMGYVPGNISAVTNKTVNLLTSPIFGLFFFAIFVPFARPVAVWIGAIASTLVAAIIAFSGPLVSWLQLSCGIVAETFGVSLMEKVDEVSGETYLLAPDPISFQWIGPTSLLVHIVVGLAFSWLMAARTTNSDDQL